MRKVLLFLIVIIMLVTFNSAVFSHDSLNYDTVGSISVNMHYGGVAVGGGTLTLYRVADITWNDGAWDFVLTDEFSDCDVDVSDIESQKTILTLAGYAQQRALAGLKVNISQQGKAKFTDLSVGLYLMMQQDAAEGYSAVNPFLITLPMTSDDGYLYDVDVSAKTELMPDKGSDSDSTSSSSPDTTKKPSSSTGKLPQTGQLNWPIPILVFVGMLIFIAGWSLCFRSRREKHER